MMTGVLGNWKARDLLSGMDEEYAWNRVRKSASGRWWLANDQWPLKLFLLNDCLKKDCYFYICITEVLSSKIHQY